MPKERKKKMSAGGGTADLDELAKLLEKACRGLWYLSETDAEIFPYVGKPAAAVTGENLLAQLEKPLDTPVEEREAASTFARLTAVKDWYGDEEKATAARFAALERLLRDHLRDLRVFKVGTIQLDVYIVGLDKKGNLAGIQTKAVET